MGEYHEAHTTQVRLVLVPILMGEAFLPIYTAHWYTVGILEENKINGWDTVGE